MTNCSVNSRVCVCPALEILRIFARVGRRHCVDRRSGLFEVATGYSGWSLAAVDKYFRMSQSYLESEIPSLASQASASILPLQPP